MIRRRIHRLLAAVAALAVAVGVLTGCAPAEDRLTLRLWDPQVAAAYRTSLAAFTRSTGIRVDVVVVPWADYFTQLRADVAAGTVDDVFWTNATGFRAYAAAGAIRPVSADQRSRQESTWQPAVVRQYSADGKLWGVPQITDPGIGLLYNAQLLRAAGLTPDDIGRLSWDPAAADDPLRQAARRLTLDDAGRHPGDAGFDAARTAQYGFGAADDLNAVLLQFLAGNGAAWQDGDRFVFASPEGRAALGYVVDLMNREQVAPSAADTDPPAGGSYLLDQFTQGRLALFPTGAYNLANVRDGARFDWGIAPLPRGPAGAISVTNGVILAASARSPHRAEQQRLLDWLGSAAGQAAIGRSGAAMPAVVSAQQDYLRSWRKRGVDVSPMLDVLANGSIQAPQGSRYTAASDAMQPILDDVFLGRRPVGSGLRAAQDAANAAGG